MTADAEFTRWDDLNWDASPFIATEMHNRSFVIAVDGIEGIPDWSITLDERGRVTQTRNGRTRRLWFGPRKSFFRAWKHCTESLEQMRDEAAS